MVEGGATVIRSFLATVSDASHTQPNTIVDMLIVTVAPTMVGDRGVAYLVDQVGVVFLRLG